MPGDERRFARLDALRLDARRWVQRRDRGFTCLLCGAACRTQEDDLCERCEQRTSEEK